MDDVFIDVTTKVVNHDMKTPCYWNSFRITGPLWGHPPIADEPPLMTLTSQWTHDVIIPSLLCQNYVTTSFWRNNDVIVTSCVHWGRLAGGYQECHDETWTDAPLRWRHNDHAGVSNHQPHGCLLNRLFRHRSNKTSKLCVTGLWAGNSPGPVNSPHKGPVTRKMFPFDDVIMTLKLMMVADEMPSKSRQTISNHHTDWDNGLHYSYYATSIIKQAFFERGQKFGNPLISLLRTGSTSHNDYVLWSLGNFTPIEAVHLFSSVCIIWPYCRILRELIFCCHGNALPTEQSV